MLRTLTALVIALAACGYDPDTSTDEQSISACVSDTGIHIDCFSTDRLTCALKCNPTGYCPGDTASEIAYCGNSSNCGRPEYPNLCVGAPCPFGNPHFVHWCIVGEQP